METWHKGVQRKLVQYNIQGERPGAETSRGVVHLQNQNYLCKGSLKYRSKVINGHKKPSDSHNYHDENHDEI